tara:strand:- start:19 stop:180 length:162 start_codon:yes stop_codon:yes gene_type:complete
MPQQYRIEYKMIHSGGHTGNGSWHDSEKFIKDNINHLNKKYNGIIDHFCHEYA